MGGYFIDDQEYNYVDTKKSLEKSFLQSPYIIQTLVEQHPTLNKIYDKSINTLRILTIYKKKEKGIEHIAAEIRFGANGSVVDNLSAGGIAVGINLQTGKLSEYGICKRGGSRRTSLHPDTKETFKDIQIPYFQEALRLTKELHARLNQIQIIGWDLAITDNGPIFIEGNENPEISGLQTVNGGLAKKIITTLLKY